MKVPLKAPSEEELFNEIVEQNRLMDVLTSSVYIPDKYLHWDGLRHRKLPEGISLREWWYLIKSRRHQSLKDVTLLDKEFKPFKYNLVDPIPEVLHEIDLSAGGEIRMQDTKINPEEKDQYVVRSLIEEAITSSQLEGASTTRSDAKELIRTGRQPRDRSEKMIINNYITMKSISELKDKQLTMDLVFQIHGLITWGTLDDPSAAGRFRTEEDDVVVRDKRDNTLLHVPPPVAQLEQRMKLMCDFANEKDELGFIHPVIRSIVLHFWLAYDHPFADGNGRTARALFYWSMLRHEYWLFEFVSISEIILKGPVKYAKAYLLTETDNSDLTYFILYHLRIIRRAISALHEYIERRRVELKKLGTNLKAIALFNYRQRALLSHAINHPNNAYTARGHQTSQGVAYQTARNDLNDLVSMGLLTTSKIKKTTFYSAVPNLEEKLREL